MNRNQWIGVATGLGLIAFVFFGFQMSQMFVASNDVPEVSSNEIVNNEIVMGDSNDLEGVQVEDIIVGEGQEASFGSDVTVHYTGWLEDGQKFDSSVDRGEPFKFTLGVGQVIPGWELGVLGMKEGGKRLLAIQPELAYGESGVPGIIPPSSVLLFEVDLIEVSSSSQ